MLRPYKFTIAFTSIEVPCFTDERPRPKKRFPRRSKIRVELSKTHRRLLNIFREHDPPGISGDDLAITTVHNQNWRE